MNGPAVEWMGHGVMRAGGRTPRWCGTVDDTRMFSARTGTKLRGDSVENLREEKRRPRRYASRGGACERKLRCRTSSLKDRARGGPVSAATVSSRAGRTTSTGNTRRMATTKSAGLRSPALIPSGTSACTALQHSAPCWLSEGAWAGLGVLLLRQQACSSFAGPDGAMPPKAQ